MTQTEKENVQFLHSEMVKDLAKPGSAIIADLTPLRAEQWHYASAICGEAGELFDIVKKLAIYAKPATEETRENLLEELGDLEFFLEALRESFGIERAETLQHNYVKLMKKRYKSGTYSNEQAQQRADKA